MKINLFIKKLLFIISICIIIPSQNVLSSTNSFSYVSVGGITRYSYVPAPSDIGYIVNITASDNAIVSSHTISGPYIQIFIIGGSTLDEITYTSKLTIYYVSKQIKPYTASLILNSPFHYYY